MCYNHKVTLFSTQWKLYLLPCNKIWGGLCIIFLVLALTLSYHNEVYNLRKSFFASCLWNYLGAYRSTVTLPQSFLSSPNICILSMCFCRLMNLIWRQHLVMRGQYNLVRANGWPHFLRLTDWVFWRERQIWHAHMQRMRR